MYDTFFALNGKPFQLSPDPEFFYSSAGHARAYAYLKYGVAQGDGFIVISGDIGAGKTLVLRTLLDEIDAEVIVAAQLVASHLDAPDLLFAVARAFGLALENAEGVPLPRVAMQSAFDAFLAGLAAQGRRALLVVDEAQELGLQALAALRLLANFQVGVRPVLQVFLVGQPELATMLNGGSLEQLRQRVIASYYLGPLDRNETIAYIAHRLGKVGWRNDPQFDPDAYDAIYLATRGIPRLVNLLCERILFSLALHEKHTVTAAVVRETLTEMQMEIHSPLRTEDPGVVVHGLDRVANPVRQGSGATAAAIGRDMDQAVYRIERTMEKVVEGLNALLERVPAKRRSLFSRND